MITTYQLVHQDGPDVIVRLLPSDSSLSESVRRMQDALHDIRTRADIAVLVYDEAAAAPRVPTPDESEELQAALAEVLGSKVTVHPYEQPRES